METYLCIHCVVKGRVQGVFFRQSTMEKAQELGITGWVKNQSNGDVELVACGEEDNLDLLKQWLWKGPPNAHVDEVFVENSPMQTLDGFIVK